jgi:hypothetical protein
MDSAPKNEGQRPSDLIANNFDLYSPTELSPFEPPLW